MSSLQKDIEIHLPFEKLTEALFHLAPEDLVEVKKRIDERLQSTLVPATTSPEEEKFWSTGLGQLILAEADDGISLEEVLKATSRIKNSLSAEAIAERDD